MKKFALTTLAVAAAFATQAQAAPVAPELSASVSVANTYLFRGLDLGGAQVAADLVASVGGAYVGGWASSGDTSFGNEVDFFAGYAMDMNGLGLDVGYLSYVYPTSDIGFGDLAEVYAVLTATTPAGLDLSFAYNHDVSNDDSQQITDGEWNYMSLSAAYGQFGLTYGVFNDDACTASDVLGCTEAGLQHVDASYAYNDNLSFTVSVPVDQDLGDVERDPTYVASLSLPIEF